MHNLFLSTFTNKVDNKGRVSVPSSFRSILVEQGFAGIVAYSSLVHNCLECCGMRRMEFLYETISRLDPFSPQRDALETYILGSSLQLAFDGEGRILLSDDLRNVFGIADKASFIGKGSVFEVWNPSELQKHMLDARKAAIESKFFLGGALHNRCKSEKETVSADLSHCDHRAVAGRLQHQFYQAHVPCCGNKTGVQLCAFDRTGTEGVHSQNYQPSNAGVAMHSATGHGQSDHKIEPCCATAQDRRFDFGNKTTLQHNNYSFPESNVVPVGSVSFCLRGIDE